jgi:pyruvate/2-oxoglutarate dehydrogenase complex dihydrolipoamide dehydrogenase (E3) component
MSEFDLCVIGGGSGGLVVAAGGAALGAKVALVENNKLGGECLWTGCVPSKALLHSAEIAHAMRDAARFGIPAAAPQVKLGEVMERVREVIRTIEPHDSPERFRGLGVDVILGSGKFADAHTFEVQARKVSAKNFVLATGSRAAAPPIAGIDSIRSLTNETVFDLREDVPHLIVLGGGPIGCELAQAFRRLGSEVDVIEMSSRILDKDDSDLGEVVFQRLRTEGVRFHLNHKVERAEPWQEGVKLSVKDDSGKKNEIIGTHFLIAAGRKPNLDGLGLDAAQVEVEKGTLVIDEHLRTSNKNIYACGDVAGSYQFTHIAEYQAGIVLRNALFHLPAKPSYRAVPWCTFTDPELARVGLSESETEEQNIAHCVYRFDYKDIDRAVAEGEMAGFVKVVTDRKGNLLGAGIAGRHAGELIHEYVLAVTKKMNISDLSGAIHIYPTLAQINRRAADMALKAKLTPFKAMLLRRVFGLRGPAPVGH